MRGGGCGGGETIKILISLKYLEMFPIECLVSLSCIPKMQDSVCLNAHSNFYCMHF